MPPPITMLSALVANCSITPSLSETLEPPRITAYGRFVESVSRSSTPTSSATNLPA